MASTGANGCGNEDVAELRAELAEAQGAAEERDELMAELNQTLATAEIGLREMRELQMQLEQANAREIEGKLELEKTLVAAEDALGQVMEAQEEAISLETRVDDLSEENATLLERQKVLLAAQSASVSKFEESLQIQTGLCAQLDARDQLLAKTETLRKLAEKDLEEALAAIQMVSQDTAAVAQDASDRINEAVGNHDALVANLQEARNRIQTLEGELEKALSCAEESAQESIAHERTLERLSESRDSALITIETLEKERAAMQQEMDAVMASNSTLASEVVRVDEGANALLRDQNAKLAAELVSSERVRAELLAEMEQTSQMARELGNQVESSEVAHLRSEIEKRNSTIEGIQTVAEEASAQCEALLIELANRDSELAHLATASASNTNTVPSNILKLVLGKVRAVWKNSENRDSFDLASQADTETAVNRLFDSLFLVIAANEKSSLSGPMLKHCAKGFASEDSLWNFICSVFVWAEKRTAKRQTCRVLVNFLNKHPNAPSLDWFIWTRAKLFRTLGVVSNGSIALSSARAIEIVVSEFAWLTWTTKENAVDLNYLAAHMATAIIAGNAKPRVESAPLLPSFMIAAGSEKGKEEENAPSPLLPHRLDFIEQDNVVETIMCSDNVMSLEEKRAALYYQSNPLPEKVAEKESPSCFNVRRCKAEFRNLLDEATLEWGPLESSSSLPSLSTETLMKFVNNYVELMFVNLPHNCKGRLYMAFQDFVISRLASFVQQIRLSIASGSRRNVVVDTFLKLDDSKECALLVSQDSKLAAPHLQNFRKRFLMVTI